MKSESFFLPQEFVGVLDGESPEQPVVVYYPGDASGRWKYRFRRCCVISELVEIVPPFWYVPTASGSFQNKPGCSVLRTFRSIADEIDRSVISTVTIGSWFSADLVSTAFSTGRAHTVSGRGIS